MKPFIFLSLFTRIIPPLLVIWTVYKESDILFHTIWSFVFCNVTLGSVKKMILFAENREGEGGYSYVLFLVAVFFFSVHVWFFNFIKLGERLKEKFPLAHWPILMFIGVSGGYFFFKCVLHLM
jgi:hypothetical protein